MARRVIVVGLALAGITGASGTAVVAANSFTPTASVQAVPAESWAAAVESSAGVGSTHVATSPSAALDSRRAGRAPSGSLDGQGRLAGSVAALPIAPGTVPVLATVGATGTAQVAAGSGSAESALLARAARSTPVAGGAAACRTRPGGVGWRAARKIPARSLQAVVAVGRSHRSSYSSVQFWSKRDGCWRMDHAVAGRNGYAGWHPRPWDGSGLSPIGVYGLTDAGGRLPNPGTKLPYHHGPKSYASGGYRMNSNRNQVFDYVVAVNFNRYVGRPPRDDGRPNPRIPDGGIWFHTAGAGATRGCISVSKSEMVRALKWLNPAARPMMVMGPAAALAR